MTNISHSSRAVLLSVLAIVSVVFGVLLYPMNVFAEEVLPDVEISEEVSRIQDYVFNGNYAIYKVGLKNIGDVIARNVSVTFYIDNIERCTSRLDLEQFVGQNAWCGFATSRVGDIFVNVTVDRERSIDEYREDNNESSNYFTVLSPRKRPDVKINKPTLFAPDVAHQGDDIVLTALVENTSSFPSGNTDVVWFANEDEITHCSQAVLLNADAQKEVECIIRSNAYLGSTTFEVVVDPLDRLAETNEHNNRGIVVVGVGLSQPKAFEYVATESIAVENVMNEQPAVSTVNTQEPVVLGVADSQNTTQQSQVLKSGHVVAIAPETFESHAEVLIAGNHGQRNQVIEQSVKTLDLTELFQGLGIVTASQERPIIDFIAYGIDDNTINLGAGERAAVIYSYAHAYHKLPQTIDEFADVIRIANGRWPVELSDSAQEKAHSEFYRVYHRVAQMDVPSDNAAITIIAYGLKQQAHNRNLRSEQFGIKTFKSVYGHTPQSTEDWNIMQAITYSGASR